MNVKGKSSSLKLSGLSIEKNSTCASLTDQRELRFVGISVLQALTVQVISPVWIYADKFFRTGVKVNVPAVLLEMLHPSVKKYCLLTDDSP